MTVVPLDGPDGRRRLVGHGDLDAIVAPDLLPQVPGLVEGAQEVVLDLTDVGFLDSGGLRLVDRVHREAARTGARFAVVAPPGTPPRRLLDLMGMAEALPLRDA